MPQNGGLSPSPERYGGGKPILAFVVASLANSMGDAYDTTQSSNVYVELMAYGRAIAAAWSGNQRMANQWDPDRMTDFLPRWEKILGLTPLSTDTDVARRARVKAAFARIGQPANFQGVNDLLTSTLGSAFVGITVTPSSSANVWTPAGWPMGTHDPNGVINWYSTVSYLAIQVQKPANTSDGDFYALLGSVMPALDSLLPAWVTFSWYRTDIHPGLGFYLDETPNLDNEALNA